ncbi:MAG: calcium-binding protein [Yoonia sp.]
MDIGFLLLLLAGGALLVPLFGGDDDDADDENQIDGTFEDDELEGTEGDDLIRGFLGDDTINGNGGDDEIRPGEGDDIVDGGAGDDNILGSPGADMLSGGDGNDRISGGADDDEIDGGADADFIAGGAGNDLIFGGYGNSGNGAPMQEELRGDDGDDTIFIWGEDGLVRGGPDNDELVLVTGEATLRADGGTDDVFYVFANEFDDQETHARIPDFDPTRDTLVMTVDHVPDDGDPYGPFDVRIFNGFEDGISGVRIVVGFDEDDLDIPDTYEGSSAFLVGLTVDQLDPDNIEVVLTTEADLEQPQETLAAVKSVLAGAP